MNLLKDPRRDPQQDGQHLAKLRQSNLNVANNKDILLIQNI